MDFLEGIVGRFRKNKIRDPLPITDTLEKRSTARVWTYGHFKEYMLALGRGKQFLLPIDQYPDIIELSNNWHESLEANRRLTTISGKEHYLTIGFKEVARSLHLPTKPYAGTEGMVPSDVIKESQSHARQAGIDQIIGDVHSHPHQEHLHFSIGDLYGIVVSGSEEFIKGILGKDENLFVFKARESTTTGLDHIVLNQDGFSKLWYEQNGYKYLGKDPVKGEMATPIKPDAPSVWHLNLKIAKRHNLVLYSGDAKGDLVKVFPTKS